MGSPPIDVTSGRTIGQLVHDGAARRGADTLLLYEGDDGRLSDLSWTGVAERMEDLRRRLAALGVGPGEIAVLAVPNSPAFHLLWFAISSNGAAMLPVDPSTGEVPLRRLIAAVEPRCVITVPDYAERAAEPARNAGCHLLVVRDLTMDRPAGAIEGLGDRRAAPGAPESNRDVAGLLQTSGSTGLPKLVELTHANYVYSGESMARNFGLNADDRAFIALPLFHSGAQLYSTMGSLASATSIGYVPRFSASGYMSSVVRTRATWGVLFGPAIRMLLLRNEKAGASRVDSGDMRLLVYAQTVGEDEWERFERMFGDVGPNHCYGQTEATALRFGHAPWEEWPQSSIGRPNLETRVRLVDDDGRDVGIDEPGELLIEGEPGLTLMKGYRGQPELTAETIVEGWLWTGDKLLRRSDGSFEFVARASHIIKRAGENLSLPELDLLMVECPLVQDVAVAAEADAVLDQRLVAFVIPAARYDRERFVAWCVERIGRNGRPDEVVEMTEFPRTSVGKVQRGLLRSASAEAGPGNG